VDDGSPGYQGLFPDGSGVTYTAQPGSYWQVYNPSGIDLEFSHGPYIQPTFTNITAVGFFVDTLDGSDNNNQLFFSSFSVSQTIVPEPSRVVLVMVAVGACLMMRRRKVG